MDSQIAKDLDGILTVLAKHFGPDQARQMPDGARWVLVIGSLILVGWAIWKLTHKQMAWTIDDRIMESEAQRQIAHAEMLRAQYEAQTNGIEAMYESVVNPSSTIAHGQPNTMPPRYAGKPSGYEAGWVYLIQGDGVYKIGIARDPAARLANLQTASPKPLVMVHKIKSDSMRMAEVELHRQYAAKRMKGEWFNLSPEDVTAICGIDHMNYAAPAAQEN